MTKIPAPKEAPHGAHREKVVWPRSHPRRFGCLFPSPLDGGRTFPRTGRKHSQRRRRRRAEATASGFVTRPRLFHRPPPVGTRFPRGDDLRVHRPRHGGHRPDMDRASSRSAASVLIPGMTGKGLRSAKNRLRKRCR